MTRKLTILLSLLTLILLAAVPAGAAPLAASCTAGQGYDPACDADHDGDIDILDIQLTAGRWGTSGTYVADGWSLTGNAGTVPGTNFLGTTDGVALEVMVDGQRALRIQPGTSPSLVGGHSLNWIAGGTSGGNIGGGGSAGTSCGPASNSPCSNSVSGAYGTIAGGRANTASGFYGFVGGGEANTAASGHSVVAGGLGNDASDIMASVGGGTRNSASQNFAVVAGGYQNAASGISGAVGGGEYNTASGYSATVPGGAYNLAAGNFSFAAGRRAKTNASGAFVWADSNDFDFAPGAANAFTARTTGGARFILGIDGTGAATWQCTVYNGGSWGCSSDRNLKENFQPVDGREILQKLATLPITTWNAIGVDPAVTRMGPMAQDFYATFGLGDDDKVITTGDLDGVALASIQGLYQIVQEKDARIEQLATENAAQAGQIAELTNRLAAMERVLQSLQAPAASVSP